MGKTYKQYPWSYFRCPRGHKAALVAEARGRAVPPSDWDDESFDKQCYLPMHIAEHLIGCGVPGPVIARKLARKFHLPMWRALRIVRRAVRWVMPKPDWWY